MSNESNLSLKSCASSQRLAYAREILRLESEAVQQLIGKIDSDFELALDTILKIPTGGRVIVSGMGKAGFIAMKISATLASTGVPSFFLHPAEAVHGDLGRYSADDVALLLSNSGETSEILRILPNIKVMGCPIISITSSKVSSLAKHSDIIIETGVLVEAGPLGLAPTTSTTAMLALGDALSMCVLKERNLSREKFAFFHPGGNLGRSLMLVSEIMRKDEEHCIVPETMIAKDVLQKITSTSGRPGAASIVDAKGYLCGVFTDGDLRRCLKNDENFLQAPISEVMGRGPKTVNTDALAEEAIRIMKQYQIDQVIVVDSEKKPVGMVDIQDFVRTRF